jgi:hypothetical protein
LHATHRLSEEERQRILLTCNQPQYAALPPRQIVPALAVLALYIDSESSFYRDLHHAVQCHLRGRARLLQEARQCRGLGRTDAMRSGRWTSPICPSPFEGSGFTSIWWLMSGAAWWWLGSWLRWNRPRLRLIGTSGLPQKALPTPQRLRQQPVQPASADPKCGQLQCNARGNAGNTAGGEGCAQILFHANGLQLQPLLGIPVPNNHVPTRLPDLAV